MSVTIGHATAPWGSDVRPKFTSWAVHLGQDVPRVGASRVGRLVGGIMAVLDYPGGGAATTPDASVRSKDESLSVVRPVVRWQSTYIRRAVIVDSAAAVIAAVAAYLARWGTSIHPGYLLLVVLFPVAWMTVVAANRGYEPRFLVRRIRGVPADRPGSAGTHRLDHLRGLPAEPRAVAQVRAHHAPRRRGALPGGTVPAAEVAAPPSFCRRLPAPRRCRRPRGPRGRPARPAGRAALPRAAHRRRVPAGVRASGLRCWTPASRSSVATARWRTPFD